MAGVRADHIKLDFSPRPKAATDEEIAKMTPEQLHEYKRSRICFLFGGEREGQGPDLVAERGNLKDENGYDILHHTWMPPADTKLKGAVVFLHGYLHHCTDSVFARQAAIWNKLGFACGGLDYEGHGNSGGLKGYVTSMDGVVSCVVEYIDTILRPMLRSRSKSDADSDRKTDRGSPTAVPQAGGEAADAPPPDLPLFLNGESMGGAIALLTAHRLEAGPTAPCQGCLLFGPMVGIDDDLVPNCCVVSILKALMCCVPAAPLVPAPDHLDRCFADPEFADMVRTDTRSYRGGHRLKTAFEMLQTTLWLQDNLGTFKVPFVVFHGEADQVTSPAFSAKLFDEASSKDKTHVVLEGGKHVPTAEPLDTRRRLFKLMTRWVIARAEGASHDSVGPIGGARTHRIPKGTPGYFWPTKADVERTLAMGGGFWDEDEPKDGKEAAAAQARGAAAAAAAADADAADAEGAGAAQGGAADAEPSTPLLDEKPQS